MNTTRLLAINIGNTNLKLGVFDHETLICSWRAEARPETTADEYAALILAYLDNAAIAPESIRGAALVSVVPVLGETLREFCVKYLCLEPFTAAPGMKSGIRIKYDDPRALGADRLVALVAARHLYGAPLLVIDFGTATTFNALDADGNFIGGAIAPGLNMAAQALHDFTAQLPRIEIAAPPRALATNTKDALRSGLYFGYVALVTGMVERLKREMAEPNVRVIGTGGMSELLAPHCPAIQIINQDLAIEGLRILYAMNN